MQTLPMNTDIKIELDQEIGTQYIAGYDITIDYDKDCESPLEYEENITIVCFHRRYNLGNKHQYSFEEAQKYSNMVKRAGGIVLPLYLYDHSGLALNTTGFSCPWDSGCVGFVYMKPEDIRYVYGVKRIGKNIREKAIGMIKSVIQTYSMYLNGDNFYYKIEKDGEVIDSCSGYIGIENVTSDITDIINYNLKMTH